MKHLHKVCSKNVNSCSKDGDGTLSVIYEMYTTRNRKSRIPKETCIEVVRGPIPLCEEYFTDI